MKKIEPLDEKYIASRASTSNGPLIVALAGKMNEIITVLNSLIPEEEGWQLKKDEEYWFVDDGGNICCTYWVNDFIDRNRSYFGNCFKTLEEAEKAHDAIAELLKNKKT